jgi:DNA polymerase-4
MDILESFTPNVEPISIDEAFLDVAGSIHLFGPPEDIARRIRQRVRAEVALPISIGVATTKHLAKIASRVAKPDGLVVVPPGEEERFLDPLPVGMVWGIGPVGEDRLARYGIHTIGELRAMPQSSVVEWFGQAWGASLWERARNEDPRAVERRARAGSVGAQSAGEATDPERRHTTLLALADRVGSRMRRKQIAGRRMTVRVRLDDMTSLSRARVLAGPIAETTPLFRVATELVDGLIHERAANRGITLVGISVSMLEEAPHLQLTLPLGEEAVTIAGSATHLRARDLDAAVDRARERFGRPAVTRGALLRGTPEERSPTEAMEE